MSNALKQYKRNDDFIFRRIVDETILIPSHRDVADLTSIYTLNEVAAYIWECLSEAQLISEIIEAVTCEFEIERDTAAADVTHFLDEMLDLGAVLEV